MRTLLSKKLRNKKGFTLAELLIVVAIIAVLMAIMIPVFGSSRAEAILAKDTANLRSIFSEAASSDMADTGNFYKGVLYVDLKTYLNDATEVSFDSTTNVTYKPATIDATSGAVTSGATIEVTNTGLDAARKQVITFDMDMVLGTTTVGTNGLATAGTQETTTALVATGVKAS